jgi:hypothetical protein
VAILFSAGDQEPVIPLREVDGKALSTSPGQIGFTEAKVGTSALLTVRFKYTIESQPKALVKVAEKDPA